MYKGRFQSVAMAMALIVMPFLTTGTSANGTTETDTTSKQTITAKEISEGKALAEKLCAKCHAIATTDNSKVEKAPPFRTFVQQWPIESLEEALAEGIVVGHKLMPEFEFEPEDINSLLSYIASLKPAAE